MSERLRIDREQLYASGWLEGAKGKPRRTKLHYLLIDSDEEPEPIWHAAYDEGVSWKEGLESMNEYLSELERQAEFVGAMEEMAQERDARLVSLPKFELSTFRESALDEIPDRGGPVMRGPSWIWNPTRGDWDWLHITL